MKTTARADSTAKPRPCQGTPINQAMLATSAAFMIVA
jgi:hypothetical protein